MFEASGSCHTINNRSPLGLLSNLLMLPCFMEILQFWICRIGPLLMLQQFIDRVDVGVGRLKVPDLSLGGSWASISSIWPPPPQCRAMWTQQADYTGEDPCQASCSSRRQSKSESLRRPLVRQEPQVSRASWRESSARCHTGLGRQITPKMTPAQCQTAQAGTNTPKMPYWPQDFLLTQGRLGYIVYAFRSQQLMELRDVFVR
jgi:hypothetical protein